MEQVKARRAQYVESTRAALLDAGRRFFAERGFTDVSAEELVRAAGLTRGALYHHFAGKQGLFEAVFEDLEAQAATRITTAMARADAPEDQAAEGIRAFLEICSDPDYREIVLLQGPIALGWRRWRELDQRHLGAVLTDRLTALLGDDGPHPLALTTAAFYGALTELALSVADAEDPSQARDQAVRLITTMLDALR
ncbi:TetR/AcrR family transcriptional regulator [Actinomadura sp. KC06]|uniref:TetR/AcrR family transcriptional regulator n=1 Tax=Actinomadura sp. KC06 TaxID=2530369 RepID=UPI00105091C7|nr:TetR/AcrR family transcriptional regulator [Actinomadura sp. KC06]TDD35250.1 TetR/AcrR family transcriptional regulator [Actinomadura sp. KC06]